MSGWQVVAAVFCVAAAGGIVFWNWRKIRKILKNIERMLDSGINGTFTETTFDESRLSALETKFAQYLSASEVSAKNLAAQKDKIKTMIADISHQTKTPVANLLLYSELLQEEELPESAKASAEAVYEQSKKLRFLIDSLVKMSRLESGIIVLAPERRKVYPMLEAAFRQFEPQAVKKGLDFTLYKTELETEAFFDARWTAEAVSNVVENAVKYTEQGGIAITVISYEMFVRIDVADTGIGIPEDMQGKIFSRFYRSEDVREQEGVGIGLYLAREILDGENGYIKVASRLGEGSDFSIFLPVDGIKKGG